MLKKPVKILLAILLTTGISALLSGCLVKKKDPSEIETISRSTNLWHIYQSGEYIDYNVQVEDATSTTVGVLRVQWDDVADLTDPITPTTAYPVLKETTTLTYDGSTSPVVTVIRYISQINTTPADVNQGRIILHAIDDGNNKYWPYANGTSFPTSNPVFAPILFDSPMAIGVAPVNTGQTFSIAECSGGVCDTEIYRYRDDTIDVVGDSTSVETNLGTFSDPFQINFSGGTNPQNSQTLDFLGDIRNACGTSKDTILDSGRFFVFPEIGIIRMVNTCQVVGTSGETIIYTATLRDTNINY